MNDKKKLTLYVDAEIIEEAKELGLNISKVCENSLKEAIRRLRGSNNPNSFENKTVKNRITNMVGSRGFEPRTASAPGWYP